MNQLWRLDDVTIISSLKPRGTHILITRPSDIRGCKRKIPFQIVDSSLTKVGNTLGEKVQMLGFHQRATF